jgi:hypothetical protein
MKRCRHRRNGRFSYGACCVASSPCCRAFCRRCIDSRGRCRRRRPSRNDRRVPLRRFPSPGKTARPYPASAGPSFAPPSSWTALSGDSCSAATIRTRCRCVCGCRRRHRRRGHPRPALSLPACAPPVGQWCPAGGAPSLHRYGWSDG